MPVKSAIVIGGGIAGPATALALRKAGIAASVYEKYSCGADGVGGILSVAPNGLHALSIIGLADRVASAGQPIERMSIENGRGRRLMIFPGLPGLPPSRLVWRSDLYRILRDETIACGIPLHHGKRLVATEETASGITALFDDGSRTMGEVLIGADGIHSTVRRLIDPGAPAPQPDGLLGLAGESDAIVPGRADEIHFVFGRRAFLGYWLQPDGRAVWFSNLPHDGYLSTADARAIPPEAWLDRLQAAYAGDIPAEMLVRHTSAARLLVLGSTDMLPEVPHWSRGRMVLVGDAAHAPNHSSGQGVSLALESAVDIARCLRDIADPSLAFAAYEQRRRPRVTKIALQAARTNRQKAAGPVATAIMSVVMRVAARTFMTPEKMFGWVQGYRIDWGARVVPPGGDGGSKAPGASTRERAVA